MTKPGDTTDPDKYIYCSYGLAFDITGEFTQPKGGIDIWSRFIKFSTCNKQNTKHFNIGSWSNSKNK